MLSASNRHCGSVWMEDEWLQFHRQRESKHGPRPNSTRRPNSHPPHTASSHKAGPSNASSSPRARSPTSPLHPNRHLHLHLHPHSYRHPLPRPPSSNLHSHLRQRRRNVTSSSLLLWLVHTDLLCEMVMRMTTIVLKGARCTRLVRENRVSLWTV